MGDRSVQQRLAAVLAADVAGYTPLMEQESAGTLTAQLIDGSTGNYIWCERFDRANTNIFLAQDEITQTVTAQLEPELDRAGYQRAKIISEF